MIPENKKDRVLKIYRARGQSRYTESDFLKWVSDANPDNGDHCQWIASLALKDNSGVNLPEDADKIRIYLEKFNDSKRKGKLPAECRDINTYKNWNKFYQETSVYLDRLTTREIGANPDEYQIVFETKDRKLIVLEVRDPKVAQKLSQNTNWCTVGTNTAKLYTDLAPLYFFFRSKNNGYEPYALLSSAINEKDDIFPQFRDKDDSYLDFDNLFEILLDQSSSEEEEILILRAYRDFSKQYAPWIYCERHTYPLAQVVCPDCVVDVMQSKMKLNQLSRETRRYLKYMKTYDKHKITFPMSDYYAYRRSWKKYFTGAILAFRSDPSSLNLRRLRQVLSSGFCIDELPVFAEATEIFDYIRVCVNTCSDKQFEELSHELFNFLADMQCCMDCGLRMTYFVYFDRIFQRCVSLGLKSIGWMIDQLLMPTAPLYANAGMALWVEEYINEYLLKYIEDPRFASDILCGMDDLRVTAMACGFSRGEQRIFLEFCLASWRKKIKGYKNIIPHLVVAYQYPELSVSFTPLERKEIYRQMLQLHDGENITINTKDVNSEETYRHVLGDIEYSARISIPKEAKEIILNDILSKDQTLAVLALEVMLQLATNYIDICSIFDKLKTINVSIAVSILSRCKKIPSRQRRHGYGLADYLGIWLKDFLSDLEVGSPTKTRKKIYRILNAPINNLRS